MNSQPTHSNRYERAIAANRTGETSVLGGAAARL